MLVYEKKKMMGGVEVTRYRTSLENKKQNTFAFKKNLESTRVLKFIRRKSFIHQIIERQKYTFY